MNDDGTKIWMAGEYHTDDLHDILLPMASKVTVAIGDVAELGDYGSASGDTETPFILEKYISINVTKYSPSEAVSIIGSVSDQKQLISEVYPGTLRIVEDRNGNPVGLKGKLGVRYGLRFSLDGGQRYTISSVEVDALDLKLKKFASLEGDSKLLLCLINLLKADDKFKLISRYIFPLNKFVALAAIYNDMAMLPSVGELTVEDGETYMKFVGFNSVTKPGLQAVPTTSDTTITVKQYDDDGEATEKQVTAQIVESVATAAIEDSEAPDGAWASARDRAPGFLGGIGVLEWDNWDKELLRNSRSRIKKLFKIYYNAKDFDLNSITKGKTSPGSSPGEQTVKKMRKNLKPPAGRQLMPWWKRRRLRTNPFNANGELCENKD